MERCKQSIMCVAWWQRNEIKEMKFFLTFFFFVVFLLINFLSQSCSYKKYEEVLREVFNVWYYFSISHSFHNRVQSLHFFLFFLLDSMMTFDLILVLNLVRILCLSCLNCDEQQGDSHEPLHATLCSFGV